MQLGTPLLLLTLLGCTSQPHLATQKTDREHFTERIDLSSSREVEAAVRKAVASDHAVVLVHIDWSPFDMSVASPIFREFAKRHFDKKAKPIIQFHYIDCTSVTGGYAPQRAIRGWKEIERARGGGSLIHGQGEMIWIQNGQVIDVERIGYDSDLDTYIAKAKRLWGTDSGSY